MSSIENQFEVMFNAAECRLQQQNHGMSVGMLMLSHEAIFDPSLLQSSSPSSNTSIPKQVYDHLTSAVPFSSKKLPRNNGNKTLFVGDSQQQMNNNYSFFYPEQKPLKDLEECSLSTTSRRTFYSTVTKPLSSIAQPFHRALQSIRSSVSGSVTSERMMVRDGQQPTASIIPFSRSRPHQRLRSNSSSSSSQSVVSGILDSTFLEVNAMKCLEWSQGVVRTPDGRLLGCDPYPSAVGTEASAWAPPSTASTASTAVFGAPCPACGRSLGRAPGEQRLGNNVSCIRCGD